MRAPARLAWRGKLLTMTNQTFDFLPFPRRGWHLGMAIALLSSLTPTRPASAVPAMPYLQLAGPSGVGLSKLIMGTDHLGNLPLAQTRAVLDEAVRLGINAFDTAPIYTDDIELKLGAWLRETKRTDLYVITKGGFPHDLGPGTYESRLKGGPARIAANVQEEARGSRSRYDRPPTVYLMHRDDGDYRDYQRVDRPQTPAIDILGALAFPALRAEYRYFGVSNWEPRRVQEALDAARVHPELPAPVCSSPYFSLFEMGTTTIHSGGVQVRHGDMVDPHFQPGIRLMTYSPLGGFSIVRPGWQAAEARARALKAQHDRYWGHVHAALFSSANAARYQRAVAFTARFNAEHGTRYTLDQVLDAYVIAHPRTDYVVIGPRSVEELDRTVDALGLAARLRPEDLAYMHDG